MAVIEARLPGNGVAPKKPPLHKQSMGALPRTLSMVLFLWAIVQEVTRQPEMRMTLKTGLYVIVTSYLYCDYWLWMLHCFLDRKENLKALIPDIREFAIKFQDHHDHPAKVLAEDHLGEINDLCSGVAGMGLLLAYWTSPATKLIALGVIAWGSLGSLNHFYGHAITHGYKVPALFKYGQEWGLLPTAKHHKKHHTAPHEEKWNFLNGLYQIYEAAYFATGSSFMPLFFMFYTFNPIVLQPLAFALGMLN